MFARWLCCLFHRILVFHFQMQCNQRSHKDDLRCNCIQPRNAISSCKWYNPYQSIVFEGGWYQIFLQSCKNCSRYRQMIPRIPKSNNNSRIAFLEARYTIINYWLTIWLPLLLNWQRALFMFLVLFSVCKMFPLQMYLSGYWFPKVLYVFKNEANVNGYVY